MHQHEAQHEHGASGPSLVEDVSGTGWLPGAVPMYAWHRQAGSWMVMTHGNAFVQYVRDALGLQVCAIAKLEDLLVYLGAQGAAELGTYLPQVQAYRDRYGV